MPPLYDVSAEAQNDLFEIWRRIADDSVELANRIESEF
jgi:plasmid stabilization system protein ParE